jgi:hypothetical protein
MKLSTTRLERYVRRIVPESSVAGDWFITYYLIRPLLGVAVQHLQRMALNWHKIAFPHWPLDCSVEVLLESALRKRAHSPPSSSVRVVLAERTPGCVIMTHDVGRKQGWNSVSRSSTSTRRMGSGGVSVDPGTALFHARNLTDAIVRADRR